MPNVLITFCVIFLCTRNPTLHELSDLVLSNIAYDHIHSVLELLRLNISFHLNQLYFILFFQFHIIIYVIYIALLVSAHYKLLASTMFWLFLVTVVESHVRTDAFHTTT